MSDALIPKDAQREFGYMYYKVTRRGSRMVPFVWLNGAWKRSTTEISDIMKMALIKPYKEEGEISDENNMVLQQSKNVRAVPEEILPLKSSSRRKRHRQSGYPIR